MGHETKRVGLGHGHRHREGGRGERVPQYVIFLTLCLLVLHGKNRLQTAFVPPPQPSGRDEALGLGYVLKVRTSSR